MLLFVGLLLKVSSNQLLRTTINSAQNQIIIEFNPIEIDHLQWEIKSIHMMPAREIDQQSFYYIKQMGYINKCTKEGNSIISNNLVYDDS